MPLSRSQRMTVLRKIASRLCPEPWHLIDITLKQFGLPIAQVWNGDREAYVFEMTAEAPEADLIELVSYLGYDLEASDLSERPDCRSWPPGTFRLFLSHLSTERAFAAELQTQLAKYGVSCFVAHKDIRPTTQWQDEILAALGSCDALLALLHEGFHASPWTDQEIGVVMGRGLPVFAVMFDEDPYGFISRFQAFNGNRKAPEALAREIIEAFLEHAPMATAISEGLVSSFENSRTYGEAFERIGRLETIVVWNPTYAGRLRKAVKSNLTIAKAYHVPGRIEELIKRFEGAA